jgi:extracellular factor (EF) 3-hydroxypalmitic acid methyl ester biosynthesis protein
MRDHGNSQERESIEEDPWAGPATTSPGERDSSTCLVELSRAVNDFLALERRDFLSEEQRHHATLSIVHRLCVRVLDCRAAGFTREEVVEILMPVREIHSRSPFVSRLQRWPRGYAGDFETVEYICRGATGMENARIEEHCEVYSLNLPIAQQHRNKVLHQAERIATTLFEHESPRILALACGSCPDFGRLVPLLQRTRATIVLNDADADALAFAANRLASVADRCVFVPGNALTVVRRLAQGPPFDLILAGGLFDYLPDRHATFLIRAATRLLALKGKFFFTNIARGNPYASLIEHFGDWFLLERSVQELMALCAEAGVPAEDVSIMRDETGLAFLIDVLRSGAASPG